MLIDFCFKFSCKGLTILHSSFQAEEQAHLPDLKSFLLEICRVFKSPGTGTGNPRLLILTLLKQKMLRCLHYLIFAGTSNWSADYFVSTGGIGFIFQKPKNEEMNAEEDLHSRLFHVFDRDWSSNYSIPLSSRINNYF